MLRHCQKVSLLDSSGSVSPSRIEILHWKNANGSFSSFSLASSSFYASYLVTRQRILHVQAQQGPLGVERHMICLAHISQPSRTCKPDSENLGKENDHVTANGLSFLSYPFHVPLGRSHVCICNLFPEYTSQIGRHSNSYLLTCWTPLKVPQRHPSSQRVISWLLASSFPIVFFQDSRLLIS